MADPLARSSRMAFWLAACVPLLAACTQPDGDYRVIEREYVPASEVPGIDDIDLEQVSYPVLVGSVAIAAQFPDMVWPDMVNEERWRLGLSPDLQAELLYPRECLFVSPAPDGIGTVRRIIDGEVIFFRIHRAAGIDPGQCPANTGGTANARCYRITALSESSGMCMDSIATDRLASFDVVNDRERTHVVFFEADAIRVARLQIKDGCPRFNDEFGSLALTGRESSHLLVRVGDSETVHILWYDRQRRYGQSALRYLKLDREFRKRADDAITVTRSANSRSANLVVAENDVTATWLDSRFSRQFLFGVSNPSKAFLATIGQRSGSFEHLVINRPYDDEDNAFQPVISSSAKGGVWMAWAIEIQDFPPGPGMQIAWRDSRSSLKIASGDRKFGANLQEQIMHRLRKHHREFGRGPDGPLPPLECTRGAVDSPGESTPAVLVPGRGLKVIGRGNVDPESGEDGGG